MYKILFSLLARKQLQKLDKKTQKRIISVLERIRIRPERFVKKLVGDPGYRLRVGDYRIIMDIDKGNLLILVIKIGHRRVIYKRRRYSFNQ
jgi:mRNA interferase RelE/StbE